MDKRHYELMRQSCAAARAAQRARDEAARAEAQAAECARGNRARQDLIEDVRAAGVLVVNSHTVEREFFDAMNELVSAGVVTMTRRDYPARGYCHSIREFVLTYAGA